MTINEEIFHAAVADFATAGLQRSDQPVTQLELDAMITERGRLSFALAVLSEARNRMVGICHAITIAATIEPLEPERFDPLAALASRHAAHLMAALRLLLLFEVAGKPDDAVVSESGLPCGAPGAMWSCERPRGHVGDHGWHGQQWSHDQAKVYAKKPNEPPGTDEPPTVEATVVALGKCIDGLSHTHTVAAVTAWLAGARQEALNWARTESQVPPPPHVQALINAHRNGESGSIASLRRHPDYEHKTAAENAAAAHRGNADQPADVWAPPALLRLLAWGLAAGIALDDADEEGKADELRRLMHDAEQEGKRQAALMREMEELLKAVVECADDGALNNSNFTREDCQRTCKPDGCVICLLREFLARLPQ